MGIFGSLSKKIEERQEGIKPSDLLELPKSLRTLMLTINRMKALTVKDAAAQTGNYLIYKRGIHILLGINYFDIIEW